MNLNSHTSLFVFCFFSKDCRENTEKRRSVFFHQYTVCLVTRCTEEIQIHTYSFKFISNRDVNSHIGIRLLIAQTLNLAHQYFQTVIINLMNEYICRLNDSYNEIILVSAIIRLNATCYQSQLWRHWDKCLVGRH